MLDKIETIPHNEHLNRESEEENGAVLGFKSIRILTIVPAKVECICLFCKVVFACVYQVCVGLKYIHYVCI